jgi:ParB-like chromosome segregation protein Spo0J
MTFRWPFMSRRSHEEVIQELKAAMTERIQHSDRLLVSERERSWALSTQMVTMQKEGFRIVHPQAPRVAAVPSPTDEAIAERAGTNTALRRHLTKQRDALRQRGLKDDEIIEKLTQWKDPDEDSE